MIDHDYIHKIMAEQDRKLRYPIAGGFEFPWWVDYLWLIVAVAMFWVWVR